MELIPSTSGHQIDTRRRTQIESALYSAFLHFGVRISQHITNQVYQNLRGEVRDFVWSLNDAVAEGSQSVYRFLSGISSDVADYFYSSQGMPNQRQNVTPSPIDVFHSRGISAVLSRIRGIAANLKKVKDPTKHARLEDELEQWKAAYDMILSDGAAETNGETPRQSVASNHPEPVGEPQRASTPVEPQRGIVRGPEDQLEQPEVQRPRLDQSLRNQYDPWGLLPDDFDFSGLSVSNSSIALEDMAGSTAAAAAGSANSQFQSSVGRIGPNRPRRSADGSMVTFSGSRLMYTWNYNFKQCDVPADDFLRQMCFNNNDASPSFANLLEPLGHEVPWDWVPFYCTPAEWKAEIDSRRRTSIHRVGVRVTPVSKSTFFMTGATQSQPVATEHPVYIYYYDDVQKDPSTRLVRMDMPDGTAINPTAFTFNRTDYARLRNRLWGPPTGVKGNDDEVHCGKGVSRQLEQICSVVLPDVDYTELGNYKCVDERRITKSFNETMGKPLFSKVFSPKIGLIFDPVRKVQFLPKTKFYSSVLVDERYLTHSILMSIPGLVNLQDTSGSITPANRYLEPTLTAGVDVALATSGNGQVDASELFGNTDMSGDFYRVRTFTAGGVAVNSYSTYKTAGKLQPKTVSLVGGVASGLVDQQALGDLAMKYASVEPTIIKTKDSVNYTFVDVGTKYCTDLESEADVNFSQYHRKIDVSDSFIPMGADRDCFPGPKEAQEPIIIGVKPVVQLDPTSSNNSYLKCFVEWKIDYFMEIKSEYVEPTTVWTEANKANAARTVPLFADYSPNIPSRGVNIVRTVKTFNSDSGAEVASMTTSMIPPEYSDVQEHGYNVYGRTGRGRGKYDGLTDNSSVGN